ncbi:hypothetical protein IGI04_016579 [Brassica rapa subsp. trilocularis]|uniref:Uncharacterized protein n=1 Tax=Brassica rapa subsp. trilocularis TaxID=1813537 RepID=A0ABQ7MTD3_BRACM|nr:hypothetical protein IGI04_016579 [Brassica rapa subsp. trilocularis]
MSNVGIVKSRVQLYLILLVRYCPLWALGKPAWIYFWFPSQKASLLYHILPFKLRITFISCLTTDFQNRYPFITQRVFRSFLQISRQPGSDTNCWDCEIPCPTLSYLISTILSTLGLRQARMDLLLVSFPKGLVLLELDISLYIRHSLSNSPM